MDVNGEYKSTKPPEGEEHSIEYTDVEKPEKRYALNSELKKEDFGDNGKDVFKDEKFQSFAKSVPYEMQADLLRQTMTIKENGGNPLEDDSIFETIKKMPIYDKIKSSIGGNPKKDDPKDEYKKLVIMVAMGKLPSLPNEEQRRSSVKALWNPDKDEKKEQLLPFSGYTARQF